MPLMLRRLLLLFALLLAAPALALPAMWQVGSGKRQIIIYGTVHALPQGADWFSPKAEAAFNKADAIVLEMVPPAELGELSGLINQVGMLPAPVPVADRIPADLRPRYAALIRRESVPWRALDAMKSWLAAITLVQLELLSVGIDPAAGVDVTLAARARSAGKRMIGLETARGQLELFDDLPEAEQRLLLASAVDESGRSATRIKALLDAWAAGDVARIRADFDDSSLSPELEQRLFTRRNAAWVDWMKQALKQPGRYFMAVGAAHMDGPNSIIAMLQARGVKVRRVE